MKISTAEFLNLTHPTDTLSWQLPVVEKTTGGRGSLFGGVGLAAGILAMEQASGKPVLWATGQYLSITQQPVTLDLEVTLPAVGRNVTQGRVIGTLDDREIITVIGALGDRPSEVSGMWEQCPQAASPSDSELLVRHMDGITLHDSVEIRIARGMFGFSGQGTATKDGNSLLWVRMPKVKHDAAALAILADYMPSALGNALGRQIHCTSLDNTIRIANRLEQHMDDEWILCDNRIEFVGNGFAHGTLHMWSEDGALLATASQSMIVRVPKDE